MHDVASHDDATGSDNYANTNHSKMVSSYSCEGTVTLPSRDNNKSENSRYEDQETRCNTDDEATGRMVPDNTYLCDYWERKSDNKNENERSADQRIVVDKSPGDRREGDEHNNR